MKRQHNSGFTLIEIMIVVAIIALLAAIAIPNVLRGRTTANESSAIGNLRSLVSSLEMYRSVNNTYPTNAAGAWQADLYTNANPDFGPPSFNIAMAGADPADVVSGFEWTYTGVAAGTTYDLLANPQAAATGTRAFHADETGLVSHCNTGGGNATLAHFTDADEATIDAQANACD